jgi:hypothetical protein
MKTFNYTLCVVLAVIMHALPFGEGWGEVYAQKVLKDTMLHVVKSFQPTIADAYKINEMPVVKDSAPPIPQLAYGINSKKIIIPFNITPLKSAKMGGEPLPKLYNSLVKIGGGNYSTPYAEIFYNNLRSKEISYGAHLKHLSSKATYDGVGFGGYSDNGAALYARKFLRKHTLSADFDYSRNVIHYYGYDTALLYIKDAEAAITKQRYSKILGNISLQSHYTDSIHFNYWANVQYCNVSDFYKTSENNIRVTADGSGYYEKQLIHIPLSVDYYNNRSKRDSSNSVIAGLAPYLMASGNKWKARIGMSIAIEGNENDKSRFLFYPNIDFNYNVLEDIIIPYAGFSGGLMKNSLQTLTVENPFLTPAPYLKNTNTKWKVYGGIRGSISKNISYNTHASFSKVEDMCFFINDDRDVFNMGFNTLYDDVNFLNIHGELEFQSSEKIKIIAKGDYNKYGMAKELYPWQRPLWQTTLTANYNLKNKIIATADIFLYGKRNAKVEKSDSLVSVFTVSEMKAIADINIGLEYRYSKKLSGFIKCNNLGFKRYAIWNNYPSQRFNFLMGISMVF